LYALLCFAIIIPAEKFIKEMFGFKDRLGSPLGAFATGAMASKLMSSLGKKGGSSGGKDEENESSLNELPPKTAKIPEVDGESKKGLEAGSDTDGNISGSSAAGAHQDSDDPIGDAEREAREERIAEGLEDNDSNMIAAGTGAAIGVAAADNTEGGKDVDKQLDQNEAYSNELKKQSMLGKISSVHNQRMAKKWGSTNRGRRWVNRGKKLAGNAAKFAVRTAGAGAGALVGGTIGMMTGNGAAGALLGAGIGRGAGNKVIKGATGAVRTAKDYRNAFRSDASREKQALRAFKADKQQVNRAVVNFRDVHKREPSARELDREMNDRFALSRYGIKDEKIDKAVGSYQKLREQQGMSQERALNQTAMAAKLADKEGLKGKDYMNKKTMNEAIETYTNNFVAKGIKDRNVAREQARKVFEQSAEIEGYKFALK